jgi:hypothetical protein
MARIDWFGRHKREIWEQLCERVDADFFQGKWNKPDRIEAYHGPWMITIDTYSTDKQVYTRMRAPYINRDDFQFRVFRSGVIARWATKIGLQDIEVGYEDFDHDFVIQGNDEKKLKMMFANPHIRKLISYQPTIELKINPEAGLFQKPKFPDGVNELYYQKLGVIKDVNHLHDLFDLFAITLDHLCQIGSAYEDDPDFFYYEL